MKKSVVAAVSLLASVCMGSVTALAGDVFPSKPIHIVVPFKAGGGVDVSTRFLATAGEKYFGVPLIVENRPGGSGLIGTGEVANGPADGYALIATTSGAYSAAPHIFRPSYDPETAFTPIVSAGNTAMFLIAGPAAPAKDFKSFYDYAKAHPDKVTVGCAGMGDISGMQLVKAFKAMGLKVRIVPFNGAAETASNTLGGHVMYGNISDSTAKAHVIKGTFKPIFVFGGKVSQPPYESVPTLADLGYKDADSAYYRLIVAPAKTPADVLARLREGFGKIIADPEVGQLFEKAGASLDGATVDADYLTTLTRNDYRIYGELIRELGLSKK